MTQSPGTLAPTRADHALLRNMLLRLTALPRLMSTAVVIITALIWYGLVKRMLAFGLNLDFSEKELMGTQANDLLQKYNPYAWWALAALFTILVVYLLVLVLRGILRRARKHYVDDASFHRLSGQLSPAALEVLLWVWPQDNEPLQIQDLQRARTELRAGRAARLQRAAQQRATLQEASQQKNLAKE